MTAGGAFPSGLPTGLAPDLPTGLAPSAPSLRRNAVCSLAGSAAYALCQWLVLAVLARLAGAHEVGLFALALAITAPAMLGANLQLRALLVADVRGTFTVGHYVATRLASTAAAMAVIAIVALTSRREGDEALVILAMACAKAVEAVAEIIHGLFQRHERQGPIALSLAAKGAAGVAALSAVLIAGGALPLAILALAGGWLAVLVAFDLPRARRHGALHPAWDGPAMARLAIAALPLGSVTLLLSLNAAIPCFFIDHHQGTAALGHYSIAIQLLAVGTLAVIAVANAAATRLARHHGSGDGAAFRALLARLLAVALAVGLAGLIASAGCGRMVLGLAYGPAYAADAPLLLWLTAAAAVQWLATPLGFAATAAGRHRIQLPIAALCCAVCTAACAVLVPSHGTLGAAWAGLATALVHGLCFLALSASILRRLGRRDPQRGGDDRREPTP